LLSSLGSDAAQIIKFGFALVIILAAVGMFILILRRLTGGRLISSEREHNRSRQPRLGVVDVYDLDRSRQLVLLRRDNVEHLLLLGGPNDVVIETNIVRVAGNRTSVSSEPVVDRGELSFDRAPEPPTARFIPEQPVRPVFEAPGSFRSGVNESVQDFAATRDFAVTPDPAFYGSDVAHRAEPVFEAPLPVQPPMPDPGAAATQAAIAAASIAAVAAATRYGKSEPVISTEHEVTIPEFLREQAEHRQTSAPYPDLSEMRPETEYAHQVEFPHVEYPHTESQLPDETEQSSVQFEETVHPEFEPIARPAYELPAFTPVLPTEPEIEPEPYQEPVIHPESEFEAEISHEWEAEPELPQPELHQPEIQVPEVRIEESPAESAINLDEAMLSDMARQLEEALKGPINIPSAPDISEPVFVGHPTGEQGFEQQTTKETGHSEIATFPAPAMHDESHSEIHLVQEGPIEPSFSAVQENEAVTEGQVKTDEVLPVEQKPLESQLAPLPKANDPFSVDDIEAEFARLLGRKNDKA